MVIRNLTLKAGLLAHSDSTLHSSCRPPRILKIHGDTEGRLVPLRWRQYRFAWRLFPVSFAPPTSWDQGENGRGGAYSTSHTHKRDATRTIHIKRNVMRVEGGWVEHIHVNILLGMNVLIYACPPWTSHTHEILYNLLTARKKEVFSFRESSKIFPVRIKHEWTHFRNESPVVALGDMTFWLPSWWKLPAISFHIVMTRDTYTIDIVCHVGLEYAIS